MASPRSSHAYRLPPALYAAAMAKIREIVKQRNTYGSREWDARDRASLRNIEKSEEVYRLLNEVLRLLPSVADDDDVIDIGTRLDEMDQNTPIPENVLDKFEDILEGKMFAESQRFDMAELYGRLIAKWLSPLFGQDQEFPETQTEEGFEIVEDYSIQALKEEFEKTATTPTKGKESEAGVYDFLKKYFSTKKLKKSLKKLRRAMRDGPELWFDIDSLEWCISDLCKDELLSQKNKTALAELQRDKAALKDTVDVLNTQLCDKQFWDWDGCEHGLLLRPYIELSGKERMVMDADVLHIILLHFIGVKWCTTLMDALTEFQKYHFRLERRNPPTRLTNTPGIDDCRESVYHEHFASSQLARSVTPEDITEDEEYESPVEARQNLLRHLTTDIHLRKVFEGDVAVLRSEIQSLAKNIPHCTILAVLDFFGVSYGSRQIFERFLEAPFDTVFEGTDVCDLPRLKRGIPTVRAMETFLSEIVLFALDVAINEAAATFIYRINDELWLCDEPQTCATGWEIMQEFAEVMGLEFAESKTGSAYISEKPKDPAIEDTLPKGRVLFWGLVLHEELGDWDIHKPQLDFHVSELSKQLEKCDDVLSWVYTWNTYMECYFEIAYGEPANCFGKKHVETMIHVHKYIHETIFGQDKTLSSHLKGMLKDSDFEALDNITSPDRVPDSFIYLPEQFGGLGVRNPIVRLQLFADLLPPTPQVGLARHISKNADMPEEICPKFLRFCRSQCLQRSMANREAQEDSSSSLRPLASSSSSLLSLSSSGRKTVDSFEKLLCSTFDRSLDITLTPPGPPNDAARSNPQNQEQEEDQDKNKDEDADACDGSNFGITDQCDDPWGSSFMYNFFFDDPRIDMTSHISESVIGKLWAMAYEEDEEGDEDYDPGLMAPEVLQTLRVYEDELRENFNNLRIVDRWLLPLATMEKVRERLTREFSIPYDRFSVV